jgi:hypothetical protein
VCIRPLIDLALQRIDLFVAQNLILNFEIEVIGRAVL